MWSLAAAFLLTVAAAPSDLAVACQVDNAAFDEGLALLHAYNHDAAVQRFAAGLAQDANCVMCVWGMGVGYATLHVTYGADYPAQLAQRLHAAWQQAQAARNPLVTDLLADVHAFVQARQPRRLLQQDRADRLRKIDAAYPNHPDLQFLLADALLGQVMASCHGASGHVPEDAELLQVLERGLRTTPRHAGLHHLMIHATERTHHPERGLASARLLPQLEPNRGHMVHMPGHIYLRLGMYKEAQEANVAAIAVDQLFLQTVPDAGWYYDALVLHNHHFLWFTLLMQQDFAAARATAATLVQGIRPQTYKMPAQVQFLASAPVITAIRMGEPVALAPKTAPYVRALGHLANGLAALQAGNLAAAQASQDALLEQVDLLHSMQLADMGQVANTLLAAQIAAARGEWAVAYAEYESAIQQEDDLPYMEPWAWQLPVREFYAAALMHQGEAARAVSICDDELARHPRSPYALDLKAQVQRPLPAPSRTWRRGK